VEIFTPIATGAEDGKATMMMMTNILTKIQAKGWTAKSLGERWGIGVRQMSRKIAKPKQIDLDAVEGLPNNAVKPCKNDIE